MQIDAATLGIIVSLVAVAIASYTLVRARQAGTPITGQLITSTLQDASTAAKELTEVALTGTRAAEQLYRTGRITRDDRLTHALHYVRQWFPEMEDDTLITAIESAVLLVNNIASAMPDKVDPPAPTRVGRMGHE